MSPEFFGKTPLVSSSAFHHNPRLSRINVVGDVAAVSLVITQVSSFEQHTLHIARIHTYVYLCVPLPPPLETPLLLETLLPTDGTPPLPPPALSPLRSIVSITRSISSTARSRLTTRRGSTSGICPCAWEVGKEGRKAWARWCVLVIVRAHRHREQGYG